MKSAELLAKLFELRKLVHRSQPNTSSLQAAENMKKQAEALQKEGNTEKAEEKLKNARKIEAAQEKALEKNRQDLDILLKEILAVIPDEKRPYFDAFLDSIQPRADIKFDQDKLAKQLLAVQPDADVERLNFKLYQFLLNIAHTMYSVENIGIPEQIAYNIAYIFDDEHVVMDYLVHHLDAATSATRNYLESHPGGNPPNIVVMHDAGTMVIPEGDFNLGQWRNIARDNYSNATLMRVLALAADIEKAINNHALKNQPVEVLKAEDEKLKSEISSLKQELKRIRYIEIPREIKEKAVHLQTAQENEVVKSIQDKNLVIKARSDQLRALITSKLCHLAVNHPDQVFHDKIPLVTLEAFRELALCNSSAEFRHFAKYNHSSKHFERFCELERKGSDVILPPKRISTDEAYITCKLPVDVDIAAAARAATAGEELGRCCQSLNNAGRTCVEHLLTSDRGGAYFTTKTQTDQLIGMCWIWAGSTHIENEVGIVIDSLEQHRHCNPKEEQMLVDDYGCLALEYVIDGTAVKVNIGDTSSGISQSLSVEKDAEPIKPIDYSGYRDSNTQRKLACRDQDFIFTYVRSKIVQQRAFDYNLRTYNRYVGEASFEEATLIFKKFLRAYPLEFLFNNHLLFLPQHRPLIEIARLKTIFKDNGDLSVAYQEHADGPMVVKEFLEKLKDYHKALQTNDVDRVVALAIEHPDLVDCSNNTYGTALRYALMLALRTNSIEPVQKLLALGAQVKNVPKNDFLQIAAESDSPVSKELCYIFIRLGSQVKCENDTVIAAVNSAKVRERVLEFNIMIYREHVDNNDFDAAKALLDRCVNLFSRANVFNLRSNLFLEHRVDLERTYISLTFRGDNAIDLENIYQMKETLTDDVKSLITKLYPYFHAIKSGDEKQVIELAIQNPEIINYQIMSTGTALSFAIKQALVSGAIDTVVRLLDLGANINDASVKDGFLSSMESQSDFIVDFAEMLVLRGFQFSPRSQFWDINPLPLIRAMESKNKALTRMLLYYCKEPCQVYYKHANAYMSNEDSSLSLAIENQWFDVAFEIIASTIPTAVGCPSWLERISQSSFLKLVNYCIDHGSDDEFNKFLSLMTVTVRKVQECQNYYHHVDILGALLEKALRMEASARVITLLSHILPLKLRESDKGHHFAFFEAVQAKHRVAINMLFPMITDFNFTVSLSGNRGLFSVTPIELALMMNDTETFDGLIALGANFSTVDLNYYGDYEENPSHRTLLHKAAEQGAVDFVSRLATLGRAHLRDFRYIIKVPKRKVHDSNLGRNVFLKAINIVNTSWINARDINGYTPLHLAVIAGHVDVALELIKQGADVNPKCLKGCTAYDYLIATDAKINISLPADDGTEADAKKRLLMSHLLVPNLKKYIDCDDFATLVKHLSQYKIPADRLVIDEDGNSCTLLMYALENGSLSCVNWMLRRCHDVTPELLMKMVDSEGDTLLTYLLAAPKDNQLLLFSLLMPVCQDLIFRENHFQESFYEQCMQQGSKDLKAYLRGLCDSKRPPSEIQQPISPRSSGFFSTPKPEILHDKHQQESVLRRLIAAGDPDQLLLFIAANKVSVDTYLTFDEDQLVREDQDTGSIESASYSNEMSYASSSEDESAEDASEDGDAPDLNRCTLLMHACQLGQNKIVTALLTAGANPNLTDIDGDNALVYALAASSDVQIAMVTDLLQHGADPHRHNGSDECFFDRIDEFELPEKISEHLKSLNTSSLVPSHV